MSAIGKFAAGFVAVGITAVMFACFVWDDGVVAWPESVVESVVRQARAETDYRSPVVRVANVPVETMPIEDVIAAWSRVVRKSLCDTAEERALFVCTEKAWSEAELKRRGYCFGVLPNEPAAMAWATWRKCKGPAGPDDDPLRPRW
jgi:hypothetical protein